LPHPDGARTRRNKVVILHCFAMRQQAGSRDLQAVGGARRRMPVRRALYFCCICCNRAVRPSTTSGSL
jgi:hypothetical protein